MKNSYQKLIKAAKEAKKNSYSPYSMFKVGAALISENGKVYRGTNIENSSLGLSVCAERAAIYKAVSEGERKFKAIAVVGSGKDWCFPCGACLQALSEFGNDTDVVLSKGKIMRIYKLRELMPLCFKLQR